MNPCFCVCVYLSRIFMTACVCVYFLCVLCFSVYAVCVCDGCVSSVYMCLMHQCLCMCVCVCVCVCVCRPHHCNYFAFLPFLLSSHQPSHRAQAAQQPNPRTH